jgi:hypothetical protein
MDRLLWIYVMYILVGSLSNGIPGGVEDPAGNPDHTVA